MAEASYPSLTIMASAAASGNEETWEIVLAQMEISLGSTEVRMVHMSLEAFGYVLSFANGVDTLLSFSSFRPAKLIDETVCSKVLAKTAHSMS